MEFIRQLVAFSVMVRKHPNLMNCSREKLETWWIHIANSATEESLLAPLLDQDRDLYLSWVDKWLEGQPPAPQEPEPELPPVAEEFLSYCVNCGVELDIDPLTGVPVDRCQACDKSSSIKEEPEPKPKKRRTRIVKSDKS